MRPLFFAAVLVAWSYAIAPAGGEPAMPKREYFEFGERPEKAIRVSIIELIANPQKYHKKRVCVVGLVILGREGPGRMHPDTGGLLDDANRIDLGLPDDLSKQADGVPVNSGIVCGPFYADIGKGGEVVGRIISIEYLKVEIVHEKGNSEQG
ncbi:MAG TPA: hypothetical protein VMM36_05715 [Opitutaceae bacterium]|nr:hypothetical protein [Opitutaceae bacterium]